MKKISVVFLLLIFCAPLSFSQFDDRFQALNQTNLKGYATPFATSFGMAMNSEGFNTASIPKYFGFSIGLRAMYILIPESDKKFTPVFSSGYNPTAVASIYGDKGGAFIGPNGYQVTPPGLNISAIPMAYPQATVSFMGTELLLRLLPKVKFSQDAKVNMLGIGVRHNISQYIPLFPIDLAVQVLYNKFEIISDSSAGVSMKSSNLAFNVHASKTFAIITPYIGLQYETSSMDIDYSFNPTPEIPTVAQKFTVSLDGDNSVRAVIGFSLNLMFANINIDANFGSQTVLGAGLSFGL